MIYQWLIVQLMNYIVGSDIFGKIQKIVKETAEDDSLSGTQKREKVLARLKDLGTDIATHLLSFAVEAAVTLLKAKIK